MVGIGVLPQASRGSTTTLAGVIVSLPSFLPLLNPVGAIIGSITAPPIWIVRFPHTDSKPIAMTTLVAKLMFKFLDEIRNSLKGSSAVGTLDHLALSSFLGG